MFNYKDVVENVIRKKLLRYNWAGANINEITKYEYNFVVRALHLSYAPTKNLNMIKQIILNYCKNNSYNHNIWVFTIKSISIIDSIINKRKK